MTYTFSLSPYTVSGGQHGIEVVIELKYHFVVMEHDTAGRVPSISEETRASTKLFKAKLYLMHNSKRLRRDLKRWYH